MALGSRGHQVLALATSPDEAVAAVERHHPDVCLLDVYFPEGPSLTAIARMRACSPQTKVVMLSGGGDAGLVGQAIAAGAAGYVGKEKPIQEIVEMLDRAMAGQVAVDPGLLQRALRPSTPADDPLWPLRFLTDREWQVMRCIMEGQTTTDIARSLGVQRSTARTHVQNLLTKLGVHSRLQAAALMSTYGTSETWPAHLR